VSAQYEALFGRSSGGSVAVTAPEGDSGSVDTTGKTDTGSEPAESPTVEVPQGATEAANEPCKQPASSPPDNLPTPDSPTPASSVFSRLAAGLRPLPTIGIICLEGPIVPSSAASEGLLGRSVISPKVVRSQLRAARDDSNIKAVVLRIDSPGGEAIASEQIWEEVQMLRAAGKPVVTSMGATAASGGYMIACACDQIVANAATVTGSIGVLSGALDASRFLRQQRITVSRLHQGTPPPSASAPLSSAQRREMRAMAAEANASFEAKVAFGRGLSLREVRKVGGGRVWTGKQAAERGLVDAIGGVEEACTLACTAAGLEGWAEGHVATREIAEQPASGGLSGLLTSSSFFSSTGALASTSAFAASLVASLVTLPAFADLPAWSQQSHSEIARAAQLTAIGADHPNNSAGASIAAAVALPSLLTALLGGLVLEPLATVGGEMVGGVMVGGSPQALTPRAGVLLAQLPEIRVHG